MRGLGAFPAGKGPAGSAPVASPSEAVVYGEPPSAAYFDLTLRRTRQLEDGSLAGMDPIDQRAIVLVGLAAGDIKSTPTLGHPFRTTLRNPFDPGLQAKAEAGVAHALSALTGEGHVRILGVVARGAREGRVEVAVNYLNLRTGRAKTLGF
ncbi:hypothetical protein LZC95_19945 [Pendulispora brunnea]|uniref:Uncharacterized protein n=1 Tax=Pendulispora brunnea TaxID=2905690 RepID=A0ABZ2KN27_9BACT